MCRESASLRLYGICLETRKEKWGSVSAPVRMSFSLFQDEVMGLLLLHGRYARTPNAILYDW